MSVPSDEPSKKPTLLQRVSAAVKIPFIAATHLVGAYISYPLNLGVANTIMMTGEERVLKQAQIASGKALPKKRSFRETLSSVGETLFAAAATIIAVPLTVVPTLASIPIALAAHTTALLSMAAHGIANKMSNKFRSKNGIGNKIQTKLFNVGNTLRAGAIFLDSKWVAIHDFTGSTAEKIGGFIRKPFSSKKPTQRDSRTQDVSSNSPVIASETLAATTELTPSPNIRTNFAATEEKRRKESGAFQANNITSSK